MHSDKDVSTYDIKCSYSNCLRYAMHDSITFLLFSFFAVTGVKRLPKPSASVIDVDAAGACVEAPIEVGDDDDLPAAHLVSPPGFPRTPVERSQGSK